MARLFDEVLNNGVFPTTADVLINFTYHGSIGDSSMANAGIGSPSPAAPSCNTSPGRPDAPRPASPRLQPAHFSRTSSAGSPIAPSCNISPGRPDAPRPASPRLQPAHFSRTSSVGSPTRTGMPSSELPGVQSHMISIRCHSMVLRTQTSLLDALLPSNSGKVSRPYVRFGQFVGAGTGDTGNNCDNPAPVPVQGQSCTNESETHEDCNREPWSDADCDGSIDKHGDRSSNGDQMFEVSVDDEPEAFLEMLRFVYLGTCNVDQSNVKTLLRLVDKYGIDDLFNHCIHQWLQENFTASLFYDLVSFDLQRPNFHELVRHHILLALRSRRQFVDVTTRGSTQWERLPVTFLVELLSGDELPIVGEEEVLRLLSRWASASVNKRDTADDLKDAPESPLGLQLPDSGQSGRKCKAPAATGETSPSATCEGDTHSDSVDAVSESSAVSGCAIAATLIDWIEEHKLEQNQKDMIHLLCAFRKDDMFVQVSEIEPILDLLGVTSLLSTRSPRLSASLDPGFVVYRGVAGVNVPPSFGGEQSSPWTAHPWRGGSIILSGGDFIQQSEGFQPSAAATAFPRLCTRVTCSSWNHREKRTAVKTAPGLPRHSISGPMGGGDGQLSPWDSMGGSCLMRDAMAPVSEAGGEKAPQTLKNMSSQDDWDIGRKGRTAAAVPNLSDAEKIDHKVVCSVVSGRMRHGIRIGQLERSSIYTIEAMRASSTQGLDGASSTDAFIGGTPTEIEFDLQLSVDVPSPSGICRCTLAVLPSRGSSRCSGSPSRAAANRAGGPMENSTGTVAGMGRMRTESSPAVAGGNNGGTPTQQMTRCSSIHGSGYGMSRSSSSCGLINHDREAAGATNVSTKLPYCEEQPAPVAEPYLEVCFDVSVEENLHFHLGSHHFDSNSAYTIAMNWVLGP